MNVESDAACGYILSLVDQFFYEDGAKEKLRVNKKGRIPPSGGMVPGDVDVQHAVFSVEGSGYDRLDMAIADARGRGLPVGNPNLDEESSIRLTLEDQPVQDFGRQKSQKGATYKKKGRRK